MSQRIEISGLSVSKPLYDCIATVCDFTKFSAERFWAGLAETLTTLTPRNRALLEHRDHIQATIDAWHKERAGKPHETDAYRAFLESIGYVLPEGDNFTVSTTNVDDELAKIAGPQLVVPATNARYALNAANARWGSLYDAIYGTDMISDTIGIEKGPHYNPPRGILAVSQAALFLDEVFTLDKASHTEAVAYSISNNALMVKINDGRTVGLAEPAQFVGYTGGSSNGAGRGEPSSILLVNQNLHAEIVIDRSTVVGGAHPAGISDIQLEAAITTILDLEDSVACVDGEDKAAAYTMIFGLFTGQLTTSFMKDGKKIQRALAPDRTWTAPDGKTLTLPGRSLMLIRNAAHHTLTDAVLHNGHEIYEGILDCFVTALMGMVDVRGLGKYPNSRKGSIYLIKPKMHAPDEMAFARDLFAAAESVLDLPVNTLKMGVMDEERRATVNLKACLRELKERLILINTGFLDRTGDEIHTSMEAGPMLPRAEMRESCWITAYEKANVDVGLACGLGGKGQVGKGMWAKPDCMAEMVAIKISQPLSGANTAWVPSPTAAVLHAMHYHLVDVAALQATMKGQTRTSRDELLTIPLMEQPGLPADIQRELDGNCQGILGYVARWVEQGIGASKIPDLDDVGLMEDRATLRIASQYLANWMLHNVISEAQVEESLRRMAAVVDRQNADDPAYHAMSVNFDDSVAFQAARDLIFKGRIQPNGYTEHILTMRRKEAKRKFA